MCWDVDSSSDSGWSPVLDLRDHGNEPWGSIKDRKCLQLRRNTHLKTDSAVGGI